MGNGEKENGEIWCIYVNETKIYMKLIEKRRNATGTGYFKKRKRAR